MDRKGYAERVLAYAREAQNENVARGGNLDERLESLNGTLAVELEIQPDEQLVLAAANNVAEYLVEAGYATEYDLPQA